jgi:hypothetical protein
MQAHAQQASAGRASWELPRNLSKFFTKILISTRTPSKVPLEPPLANPPSFALGARKKHAFYLRTVMNTRGDWQASVILENIASVKAPARAISAAELTRSLAPNRTAEL